MRLQVESPLIETAKFGAVPAVDAVATHDAETGASAIFLVHRGRGDAVELRIDVAGLGDVEIVEAHVLHDDDPYARNTLEDPERVQPRTLEARLADGILHVTLPPIAWAALSLRRLG